MGDLEKIGVPPLYQESSLKSLVRLSPLKDNTAILNSFLKLELLGLAFIGNNGTGKTTTCCAIAMDLHSRDISVYRSDLDTMLQEFQANSFVIPKKFVQPQVLILEEVGKELNRNLSKTIFEKLIRHRIEYKKSTVLSSNVGSGVWENLYGVSVISLLKGYYKYITFPPEDLRALQKPGAIKK